MIVKLSDVCKRIYAGGDVPKDRFSEEKTDVYNVPIYANAENNQGLYGYTDLAREFDPAVTVAARGTIGYAAIRTEPFLPVVRLITVVPDVSKISLCYLYYALKHYKPKSSGTSIPQLTVPTIKNYTFNLCDIEKQASITSSLDKLQYIIKLYQKQLDKLDELVKARFVEMFGDPQTNPFNFEKKELRSSCSIITGNTPSRAVDEYYGDHIEWIKTDNIVSGKINPTQAAEFLSEEGLTVGRTVNEGTILMVCIAGSVASIGRVCITDRKVAFNQQINAIVPNLYDISFLYVLLQISKDYLVEEINMSLKGIISKSKLEEKVFILPPIEQQKAFADFSNQINKSKVAVQKALDEAQLLFDSLMQEYFG